MANAPWNRAQPFEHAAFAAACRGHSKKKRFRPSEQLRRDVEEKRAAFLEEVKSIAPDRLIFIDESGCNIAMSPTYGRAPRGQRVLDHKPANWGRNVSIVGAVRADRVLAHQTFDGAVNGPNSSPSFAVGSSRGCIPETLSCSTTFALITHPRFARW